MADWQNLDPEAAREAEKYENPIPSRELILAHLSERGAPATRSQLLDEFGLAGEEPEEALRRRLRAMERDGQLIYTRRGAYAPVDKLDLIRGRISGHRDGFGFLIPDDGSDDLFLSPTQMRLVFDGDRALARVSGHDRRGRREGQLVEVIERAHEIVVGRYFEESGIGVVVADNPKIQQEVLIPPGKAGKARHNQFVQVRIEQWPSIHRQAQGEIVEVLGDYMAPGMEIEVALRSYDIPTSGRPRWRRKRPSSSRKWRRGQGKAYRPAPGALRHHRRRGCPRLRRRGVRRGQARRRLAPVRGDRRCLALREGRFGAGRRGGQARQLGVFPRAGDPDAAGGAVQWSLLAESAGRPAGQWSAR